jgi:hypothetical protein
MLSFANMLHFLPHKFARLRRRRLPFARVLPRSFHCFLFWHGKRVSPQYAFAVVRLPADFRID